MKQDVFSHDDFGFYFLPRNKPGLHGHERLEVRMHDQPTFEHFDPEQIKLAVKIPSGTNVPLLDEVVLFHPWRGAETYEVGCGHIFISDRKGKKVDAFTFGGEVHIHSDAEATIVVFESPAPIFEVTPVNPVVDLFIDEVEILLAMRRAEWLQTTPHLHAYEERLCRADPVDLYLACLLGVEERLARVYDGASEKLLHLQSAIRAEMRWLKETGVWLGERRRVAEVV